MHYAKKIPTYQGTIIAVAPKNPIVADTYLPDPVLIFLATISVTCQPC
jgi:hypothetical protein